MIQLLLLFLTPIIAVKTDSRVQIKCSPRFDKFSQFCLQKQKEIIHTIETEDGASKFLQEPWEKKDTSSSSIQAMIGHGITAVIERGSFIEKGAVSTTISSGLLSIERAKSISSRNNIDVNQLVGLKYHACALSLVLHSKSPFVPTFRADVRYFELENGHGWFGGGADLTPYYLNDNNAKTFHTIYKTICDQYSPSLYNKLKNWCDDYFYIPARAEHRGIGGIFFDDLTHISNIEKSSSSSSDISTEDAQKAMDFTCDVCNTFMSSYIPLVRQHRDVPYTEQQRHWQLLRRGRYVEFNLLYDRGVRFGLVPGGRTEAVLVSCPPLVAWDYNYIPVEGSEEARLISILKKPIEWV